MTTTPATTAGAPMRFDYAPALNRRSCRRASRWLFINGKWVEPKSDSWFTTINPATEEPLAEIAEAGNADVDAAVRAAGGVRALTICPARRRALPVPGTALQERARAAVLETLNGGKPIKESRDVDIPLAAAHFFYYAGWADKLEYAFPGRRTQSLGVAGQVIPWNFPLLMAAWKIAPALATATPSSWPAETTPLTALLLAEVLQEVDLPPGVVNIPPARATGAARSATRASTRWRSPGRCHRQADPTPARRLGKRVNLELGGKAANIVFEDAAIDQAVEGIVNGIYFNQGHVCCAGSRLLVQEPVAELLLSKLRRRLDTLRVGEPLDKNTDVGAINSRKQLDKIEALVQSGIDEGADIYQSDACVLPNRGFFFKPTVFTGVSQSHRIAREEIFGPVLSVLTFRTPDEAVAKANNTPYGLSAGIWTEKGSRILWMAERMKAGVVWANTFNRSRSDEPVRWLLGSPGSGEGGRHGLLPTWSWCEGCWWDERP
jgi:aldehyde dehydrogenase (NAD+)